MSKEPGRLSRWSLPLAIAGAVAVVGAPLGYRVGVLPLAIAFLVPLLGVVLSLVVLPVAVTRLVRGRGAPETRRSVISAAAISALTILWPLFIVLSAIGLPAIHDITTDIDRPPQFDTVVPLRVDAANSLEYGGASVAAAQRAAYPDIETLALDNSPARVVKLAGEVAEAMGWEIVAVDTDGGRVEATDTTSWFGFKDDVVVRVRPVAGGAHVDVRSVSRVGGGDLGANAARIREFLDRLRTASGA
jgi:uncharacterized protein (DUF1499 family)